MKLLLIHQNFPGQFRHMVGAWLARPGWELKAIGRDTAPGLPELPGLALLRYKPHRSVGAQQHHYLRKMEDAVLHGQAVARLLMQLREQGWVPDTILAHPGWGETLYAKDIFPQARLVHLCEWFYNGQGADVGFDPEFPANFDAQARVRTWNALHLLNLANADACFSPTAWQRDQHPAPWRERIHLAHEGVALEGLQPDAQAQFQVPGGPLLKAGDEVLTYVARNLEPYRGFHIFMRALPELLRQRPQAQVLIAGSEGVSYGGKPAHAPTWRAQLQQELQGQLDLSRIHFLGKLPYADYVRVLQVSRVHTYLSYPFVLSWSMLEAMACGCLVVGSDTPPVREVLRHGENGLLTPFFNPQALAQQLAAALADPSAYAPLREAARATVLQHYSLAQGQARIEGLLRG
ncbi:glycosyltransferase family 4 protein [Roseateles sp. BYS180W]|uniref:Glycosyltransferase family 4 protein n=1 Tax=Roseateles rivi TaxID=3299028 RepID=A0ABW7FTS1_9BURK